MTSAISLEEMLGWRLKSAAFWKALFDANPAVLELPCAPGRNALRWLELPDSLRFPGRSDLQSSAGVGTVADFGFSCCFWKQDRHSTGLPWVGLKGTVVSSPHSEQVVRVSERTLEPPRARFALHCLQCLGSLVNCLSWKNNCSPAVNMNSAPQSLHFNTLSTNSIAGFPISGKPTEIGHDSEKLAGPVSLRLSHLSTTRARAARNNAAEFRVFSADRKTCTTLPHQQNIEHQSHKGPVTDPRPDSLLFIVPSRCRGETGGSVTIGLILVCLFTSLLTIPLARQSCFYALLLAGLQIVGVTLDFLDDVLLLYLPLEPAQSIFERFAFLNTNLCQRIPPPNLPWGFLYDTGNLAVAVRLYHISLVFCFDSI